MTEFQNLLSIFLQINLENFFKNSDLLPWIPLIGSLIIAVVLWRSFRIHRLAVIEDNKARYAQILRDIDRDLSDQKKEEHYLETIWECQDFVIHYLNILERVAYLNHIKNIPDEIVEFFENSFSLGLALQNWVNSIEKDEDESEDWIQFNAYCKKQNIKPATSGLENLLEKYEQAKENENARIVFTDPLPSQVILKNTSLMNWEKFNVAVRNGEVKFADCHEARYSYTMKNVGNTTLKKIKGKILRQFLKFNREEIEIKGSPYREKKLLPNEIVHLNFVLPFEDHLKLKNEPYFVGVSFECPITDEKISKFGKMWSLTWGFTEILADW